MLIYAVADIHGRRDRVALIRSKILKHKPDVLVVAHPPPRGTLDEVFGRFHSGCRSLQKECGELCNPIHSSKPISKPKPNPLFRPH